MNKDNWLLFLTWQSALLLLITASIVVAAFAVLSRRTEAAASAWLALFLIAYAWTESSVVLGLAGAYTTWPSLMFAPFALHLFLGPLLYLHAHAVMHGGAPGWRLALLVPGAAQFAYYLWAFTALTDNASRWAFADKIHRPVVLPMQIAIAIVLSIACWIAVWKLLRAYYSFLGRQRLFSAHNDPAWLRRFLIASVSVFAIWLIVTLGNRFVVPVSYLVEYPMNVVVSLIVLVFGIDALGQLNRPYPKPHSLRSRVAPGTRRRD